MSNAKEIFTAKTKALLGSELEKYHRIAEDYADHFLIAAKGRPIDAVKKFENFMTNVVLEHLEQISIAPGSTTHSNIKQKIMVGLRGRLDARYGLYIDSSIADPNNIEDRIIEELLVCNLIGLLVKHGPKKEGFFLLFDCADVSFQHMWPSLLTNCLMIVLDSFPMHIGAIYIFNASIIFKAFIFTMGAISDHRETLRNLIHFVNEDDLNDLAGNDVQLLPQFLGGYLPENDKELNAWGDHLLTYLDQFINNKQQLRIRTIGGKQFDERQLKAIEDKKQKFAINENSQYLNLGEKLLADMAIAYIESDSLVEEEFESCKHKKPNQNHCKTSVQHQDENKRQGILCLENSRVQIASGPHDYYHANFINGVNKINEYICAQGPMQNTVDQFLRMVWENKVRLVVMLNQEKDCTNYWPREAGSSTQIGPFKLTNKGSEKVQQENITLTTVEFTNSEFPDEEPKTWTHMCPNDSAFHEDFLKNPILVRMIKLSEEERFATVNEEPILVHDKSGVRTAPIFIAVRIAKFLASSNKPFDFARLVEQIRMQRGYAFSNQSEYKLLIALVMKFSYKSLISETRADYLANKGLFIE